MRRYTAPIILALTGLALFAVGPTLPAESASPRPHYETPRCVTTTVADDTSFTPVWCAVPFADFYSVRVSKNRDLSGSRNYVTETADNNAIDVTGLEPGTTYWYVVRVSNSRGQILSDPSVKRSATTDSEPETGDTP